MDDIDLMGDFHKEQTFKRCYSTYLKHIDIFVVDSIHAEQHPDLQGYTLVMWKTTMKIIKNLKLS